MISDWFRLYISFHKNCNVLTRHFQDPKAEYLQTIKTIAEEAHFLHFLWRSLMSSMGHHDILVCKQGSSIENVEDRSEQ